MNIVPEHAQLLPGTALIQGVEVRWELLRRGHRLQEASGSAFGGYQAVRRDPVSGAYSGASESRKDGAAAGY